MIKKLHSCLPALLLIAALFSCFCNRPPQYIFFITLDTTRADFVAYHPNQTTPNLSRLACEGTAFRHAYTLIPITLPSHCAMFYSLPPHCLKVYNNGQKADLPVPSLAEILRDNGYFTGAVISLATVGECCGLNKGFDYYIENYRKPYLFYKTAAEVNRDAFELIHFSRGRKRFFWIHYSDPHEPYFSPQYGGSFKVRFRGRVLFESVSTERPLVNLELTLEPGINEIDLATTLCREIKQNDQIKIDYLNFENFKFVIDGLKSDYSIQYPAFWEKKGTPRNIEYNTRRRQSTIVVENRSNRILYGKLSFCHRVVPTVRSIKYLYKKEVEYMDAQIGILLDFLAKEKMLENSVFVIMGDHGEGLGEYNGHVGHVLYLNKIYTRVPLILSGKNLAKGELRDEICTNLNIAPTILELAGIKKPDSMQGESLLGRIDTPRVLQETYSPEAFQDSFSMIDYPYQIVYFPERRENKIEVYNHKGDEFGVMDLFDQDQELRSVRCLINDIQSLSLKLISLKQDKDGVSDKEMEILSTLGYVR